MRGKAPRGKTKTPGGRTPQGRTATREGNAPRPEQGTPAKNGERDLGTTRPKHPGKGERGTTRDARKKGDRGKSALEGSEAERGLKTLRMTRRKTTKDFYCIKVHNGCSETQLSTPIDGRMAKQQPTSGEPEKLKAQVHFQEPNDEQYGAND